MTILKHPYCSVPASHRFPPNSADCELIFTAPLDGFTTRLKVSVIAGAVFTGAVLALPDLGVHHAGAAQERAQVHVIFIAGSTVLFAARHGLAYVVLSKGLQVLHRHGRLRRESRR